MLTLMNAGHALVMTDAVHAEWERHASRWSKDWYTQMVRRRQVRWVRPADCSETETAIDADPALGPFEQAAMKKDLHLIQAARSASNEIVSLDAAARELYERMAGDVYELQAVVWLDPTQGDLPVHRP
jgi:hypothetical protein